MIKIRNWKNYKMTGVYSEYECSDYKEIQIFKIGKFFLHKAIYHHNSEYMNKRNYDKDRSFQWYILTII